MEQRKNINYCITLINQRKLIPPSGALSDRSWSWSVTINTLGRFETSVDTLTKPGKSKRIQLLILYLSIIYSERGIPIDTLYDIVWPGEDISTARHKLDNALYRLRQSLSRDALIISNSNIKLNTATVWVDVLYLLELVQVANNLLKDGDSKETLTTTLIEITNLYKGDFLKGTTEENHRISNFRIFVETKVMTLMQKCLNYLDIDSDKELYNHIYDFYTANQHQSDTARLS
jgi:DNA-binding SARP family transcriptional activator